MPSRFDYVRYDASATMDQERAKDACQSLELIILETTKGRAQAIALTKLEECYMWIGKGVRDEQIARNGSAPLQEERNNG